MSYTANSIKRPLVFGPQGDRLRQVGLYLQRQSELSADNLSGVGVGGEMVVTNRAPLAVDMHLHTALVGRRPVHQAHACNSPP
jgi:hypothetical protein